MQYYWIWLTVLSVTTFGLYGYDKSRARNGGRRIRESTLHWMALIGGFPGAWLGRSVFRHKTRKGVFLAVLLLATALHAALWWWVYFR